MAQQGRNLVVYDLGTVEYEDGLVLQSAFALARRGRLKRDVLLLLEHSPVLTLGRGAEPEDIKVSREELERHGVGVFQTDRGGNVTYHGPGQIVGYPIIDLAPDRCDVRRYVRGLEDTMIGALAEFGVKAGRIEGWTGVWVGEKGKDARKIGAIGLHLSRWVTTHGFALNLTTDLSHFDFIVPCGIREAGVTSVERELGRGERPVLPLLEDERLGRDRHVLAVAQQHEGRVAVLDDPRGPLAVDVGDGEGRVADLAHAADRQRLHDGRRRLADVPEAGGVLDPHRRGEGRQDARLDAAAQAVGEDRDDPVLGLELLAQEDIARRALAVLGALAEVNLDIGVSSHGGRGSVRRARRRRTTR